MCVVALDNQTIRLAVKTYNTEETIERYGLIKDWDVSGVTDMRNLLGAYTLFSDGYYPEFNEDLFKWDVSNVTDMSFMFAQAYTFNADLSDWNVSNVVSMEGMFIRAFKFDCDLSRWDISNVRNTSQMFMEARAFSHSLVAWDMTNVESMLDMFKHSENYPMAGNIRELSFVRSTQF